jgi:MFS family permease
LKADTADLDPEAVGQAPEPAAEGEPAARRDVLLGLACLAVVALIVVDRARLLREFGFRFTDEDQAVLWWTAEDLRAGHVRAPYFYGQSYGSWLESAVAVPLRAGGVALGHALPIAGAFLSTLPCVLLALVAWLKRAKLAAGAILAGCLVLSTELVAAASLPRGITPGIALAAVGVAVGVAGAPRPAAMVGFGLLAVVGGSLNESSVLLSAPAAAYLVLRHWRSARAWLSLALGVELGLVFHVLARAFYSSRPAYEVHYRWPLVLEREQLRDSGTRLEQYFTAYGFDFLRSPAVPLALLAAAALVLVARRGLPGLAAVVAAGGLGVATLATAKAADGSPSVFFPYFRFFFALPAVLAMFIILASNGKPLGRWVSRTAAVAVLVAAVAGFAHRGEQLDREVRRLTASDSEGRYQAPAVTGWVLEDCREAGELARAHEAGLIVYLKDRVAPYLCGAALYGQVQTLYPAYERRTWDLERESAYARTRMVVAGGGPEFCEHAAWVATACQLVSPRLELLVLEFPAQPVVPLLRQLGVTVVDF